MGFLIHFRLPVDGKIFLLRSKQLLHFSAYYQECDKLKSHKVRWLQLLEKSQHMLDDAGGCVVNFAAINCIHCTVMAEVL